MPAKSNDDKPGLWEFLLGIMMLVLAAFVLSDSFKISCGIWHGFKRCAGLGYIFAIALLVLGLTFLYVFPKRRLCGWVVWAAGMLLLALGLWDNMQIYVDVFPPFSLLASALLFVAGTGLALIAIRHRR